MGQCYPLCQARLCYLSPQVLSRSFPSLSAHGRPTICIELRTLLWFEGRCVGCPWAVPGSVTHLAHSAYMPEGTQPGIPRPLPVFQCYTLKNGRGPGMSSHVIGKGTGQVENLLLTTAFSSYRSLMDEIVPGKTSSTCSVMK